MDASTGETFPNERMPYGSGAMERFFWTCTVKVPFMEPTREYWDSVADQLSTRAVKVFLLSEDPEDEVPTIRVRFQGAIWETVETIKARIISFQETVCAEPFSEDTMVWICHYI